MRLIDADKLRKQIHCEYSDDLGILEKIDEQPTAYDVNSVVQKLESEYKENENRYKKYKDSHEFCAMSWLRTAINIVKTGETCQ